MKCRLLHGAVLFAILAIITDILGKANGQEKEEIVDFCHSGRRCGYWELECKSGHCVNMQKFCDGRRDCPDGSDEISQLSGGETEVKGVWCNNIQNNANRTCVLPQDHVCDSIQHCKDSVDESASLCGSNSRYLKHCDQFHRCINNKVLECIGCESFLESCKPHSTCIYTGEDYNNLCSRNIFRCNSGKCLTAEQFCDGTQDCEDGSDEMMSLPYGNATGIMCNNKWNYVNLTCYLPPEFLCDGIDHCHERLDECRNCDEHSFTCDNHRCIPRTTPPHVTDGVDDCGDSSDECQPLNIVFTCADGTCIAMEKFCDGRLDCLDGSDEVRQVDINSTDIYCQNIQNHMDMKCLLPESMVCDGKTHCADHSDEFGCSDSKYFECANKRVVETWIHSCNFFDECQDSSDECQVPGGCNKTFTCNNGKCIAFSRFCDGVDDCGDASDEVGVSVPPSGGVKCDNRYNKCHFQCVLPNDYVCDGLDHCRNREDECGESCRESFFCDDGECRHRHELCDGKTDCSDGSDEKVTGPGFKCAMSRMWNDAARICILPQKMLHDNEVDCFDQSDACFDGNTSLCFKCLNGPVYIAQGQVCDGIVDCPDLSDECVCERESSDEESNAAALCNNVCLDTGTKASCDNCGYGRLSCDGGTTCTTLSQVCDGVSDCADNLDERSCFNQQPHLQTREKNFTCQWGRKYSSGVECDKVPECLDFSDECSIVEKINPLTENSTTQYKCGNKTATICQTLPFNIFGYRHCPEDIKKSLGPDEICNGIEDCQPTSIPVGSSGNASVRTWSDFSVDEQICHSRKLCEKSRPRQPQKVSIHESQICDERIDCLHEEDEAQEKCGGRGLPRFYCESRAPRKKFGEFVMMSSSDPLFVPHRFVMDGKMDCYDGSDECPTKWFSDNRFSSRFRLIEAPILSILIWLMAVLALAGNLVVIGHTFSKLWISRRLSTMMKSNHLLVLNLAIADFMMGIYLLALAIQNARTNGRYCYVDREWRSSLACSALGTLAMMSVQSSVMFLVLLTTYRMVAVLRPFRADNMHVRYTTFIVGLVWGISLLLAILPHMGPLEDYFKAAAWIVPSVDFFQTDTPNKHTMQRFSATLKALSHKDFGTDIISRREWSVILRRYSAGVKTTDLTWRAITQAVDEFYPSFWPKFEVKGYFGFYNVHSVCLPQLFVTVNDSAWAYTAIIMTFDLIAFLYILVSYLVIYYDARRSAAMNRNDDENRTMQARITRLVVTDFACWGPLCVMAFLNLLGVDVPDVAYAFAAIILLPINSALNPILYSNVLSVLYTACIKPIEMFARKRARLSRAANMTRQRQRSNQSHGSLAITLTSNDCIQSPESALLMGGACCTDPVCPTSTTKL